VQRLDLNQRLSGLGPEGRRFKSCRPDHFSRSREGRSFSLSRLQARAQLLCANYLAVVLRWLLLLVALFLALASLFTTFLAPGWIDELLAAKLTAAGRPNTLVSVPWACTPSTRSISTARVRRSRPTRWRGFWRLRPDSGPWFDHFSSTAQDSIRSRNETLTGWILHCVRYDNPLSENTPAEKISPIRELIPPEPSGGFSCADSSWLQRAWSEAARRMAGGGRCRPCWQGQPQAVLPPDRAMHRLKHVMSWLMT